MKGLEDIDLSLVDSTDLKGIPADGISRSILQLLSGGLDVGCCGTNSTTTSCNNYQAKNSVNVCQKPFLPF